jgi:hypothetical protein
LRRRALSLRYHGTFEKPAKLVADLSSFRGGGLWHRPKEYGHYSDVLAHPCKDWGLVAPLITVNTAVDVASPVSGCSAIPTAKMPLFKGSSEVYQLSAVPVDLGFEFTKLFKLGLASPHGGRHCGMLP